MHEILFYNKFIIIKQDFCALSWLITRIVLRCTVSKTSRKVRTELINNTSIFTFNSDCTVFCRYAANAALCLTSATGLTSWHVPNTVTECLPKQADAGWLQSRLLSALQTSACWRTTCLCCWKKCCRPHRGPEFPPFSCTGCNES